MSRAGGSFLFAGLDIAIERQTRESRRLLR